MDYKRQREEVVRNFELIRAKLVELLEENLSECPLHQLSLSEFNLHLEHKKERMKQVIFLTFFIAWNCRTLNFTVMT